MCKKINQPGTCKIFKKIIVFILGLCYNKNNNQGFAKNENNKRRNNYMKINLDMGNEVFLEMTNKVHGGVGWGLGKCLWSPEKTKDNKDRWKVMRGLQVDDLVIHSVKTRKGHMVIGTSKVESSSRIVDVEPPSANEWSGYGTYYRVDLKDYKQLEKPVYLQKFINDEADILSSFKKSFFTKDLKPAQKYVTQLEPVIADALINYLGI